jgi:Trypsin
LRRAWRIVAGIVVVVGALFVVWVLKQGRLTPWVVGTEAPSDVNWVARLEGTKRPCGNGADSTRYCSAVAVSERIVLTASHCLNAIATANRAVAVSVQTSPGNFARSCASDDGAFLQRPGVDLSLVCLREKIVPSPIPLASRYWTPDADAVYRSLGWGSTILGGHVVLYPNTLMQSDDLSWVPSKKCREAFGTKDGSLCASGKAQREGDSGGPLVEMTGPQQEAFGVVVGVLSDADPATERALYSSIADAKGWIDSAIANGFCASH